MVQLLHSACSLRCGDVLVGADSTALKRSIDFAVTRWRSTAASASTPGGKLNCPQQRQLPPHTHVEVVVSNGSGKSLRAVCVFDAHAFTRRHLLRLNDCVLTTAQFPYQHVYNPNHRKVGPAVGGQLCALGQLVLRPLRSGAPPVPIAALNGVRVRDMVSQ